MTDNKKPATTGAVTGSKNTSDDALNSNSTAQTLGITFGWRGALALSNPGFRINGTYDAPADARRMRRILARQLKKALRKGGGK